MTFHKRWTPSGDEFFVDDSGKVFHEDAQGNMVPETVAESRAETRRLAGLAVQESGVSEAFQAERLKRRHEAKDSYKQMGLSDAEADAAAGLDEPRGAEAAYLEMGLSKEAAAVAAQGEN